MKSNKIILILRIMLTWSAIVVVLAAPVAATENKLLLDPADCVTTGDSVEVVIYTDINEVDQAVAASFDIEYDPNCVQDFPGFDYTDSGWLAAGSGSAVTCTYPASGIIRFTTMVGMNPAISGHVKVGTLTLTCNITSCESYLKFMDVTYTTGSLGKVYPAVDNGVFSCTSTSDDDGKNDGDSKGNSGITTNPTPILATSPDPNTSSNSMPTSKPATSPTSTPATTSNPASAPENENGEKPAASGFEPIISAVMLIAAVYLVRMRQRD